MPVLIGFNEFISDIPLKSKDSPEEEDRGYLHERCRNDIDWNQGTDQLALYFFNFWFPVAKSQNLNEPIRTDIDLQLFIYFSTKVQNLSRLGVKTKCNVQSTFIVMFLKIEFSYST